MEIERPEYLGKLIAAKDNGLVKVITGLRRCGKTYLVKQLYPKWLTDNGTPKDNIIYLALDKISNAEYRNPLLMDRYLRESISQRRGRCYIIIDEIQFAVPVDNPALPENVRAAENRLTFYDVLLGLMDDCDLYVTGSNSKMLSKDILSGFRDRGLEIRVHPLSFTEYYSSVGGDRRAAWKEYLNHGGMPLTLSFDGRTAKDSYLKELLSETYLKDIVEHNGVKDDRDLTRLLEVMASCSACLTNPTNIANTFPKRSMSRNTVDKYLGYFRDSFLLVESKRYDIRGRKIINGQQKYYFEDLGLMNAILNFREMKTRVLIENAVYNELIIRGYSVDVGRVDYRKRIDGVNTTVTLETDFVVNRSYERTYIQVAEGVDEPGKLEQEEASLLRIRDGFGKMILVNTDTPEHYTENGIRIISILDFMFDKKCLERI
jgi:hypothetical protein